MWCGGGRGRRGTSPHNGCACAAIADNDAMQVNSNRTLMKKGNHDCTANSAMNKSLKIIGKRRAPISDGKVTWTRHRRDTAAPAASGGVARRTRNSYPIPSNNWIK